MLMSNMDSKTKFNAEYHQMLADHCTRVANEHMAYVKQHTEAAALHRKAAEYYTHDDCQ